MRNTTFLRCSFMANFVNEDERNLELPSQAAPQAERCLWLEVHFEWSYWPYYGKLKVEGLEI
jgi:hypothetical protein